MLKQNNQLQFFNNELNAKPFLKWAGGKTQLLPEIRKYYPFEKYKNINKYCEPFLGGGAVLFDILNNFDLKEILVNDLNSELINTYTVIRDYPNNLVELLYLYQNDYWNMNDESRKKYYNLKRDEYNKMKLSENNKITKASLTIFLNRTCFNGLYRVNRKGEFNVPIGSYKKPLICDSENLFAVSNKIQDVKFINDTFDSVDSFIDNNTFVYFDPPYRPLNMTSSFKSYSKSDFNDESQIELANFYKSLNDKGSKLLLSNSDPKNEDINDDFFDDLYSEFNIKRVVANRMINSNKTKRGPITEILVSNF